MKFLKSVVLMLSILPTADAAELCPNGSVSGPVIVGRKKTKNFVRKGKDCPCSYVSQSKLSPNIYAIVKILTIVSSISNLQAEADCTVIDDAYSDFKGKDCSLLEVDGALAAVSGDYPKIKVRYDWKICNGSEGTSKVNLENTHPSYFRLWGPRPGDKNEKEVLLNIVFDTTVLTKTKGKKAKCETHSQISTLDTKVATRYMSAQIQGTTAVTGEYCYAYAFNPVGVKYGSCDVSVSALAYKVSITA